MAYDFDVENRKSLRPAPIPRIRVCKYITTPSSISIIPIFGLYASDLISIFTDLRSVETKLDNPELQASTIEIEAYWDGTKADLSTMMGTNVAIEYYVDGADYRTFFTTLSHDTVSLKNKVLKIKGTDLVGIITGQNKGLLVNDLRSPWDEGYVHLKGLINNYLDNIVEQFNLGFYGFHHNGGGAPEIIARLTGHNEYLRYVFIDDKSKRKCIAQIMNMFRGSNPNDPDEFAKRFVFRDAGQPVSGWCANGISDFENSDPRRIRTFEISYGEVSDFGVEYGKAVKAVKINNPTCEPYGSLHVLQTIDTVEGESWVVNSEEPQAAYHYPSGETIKVRNAYTIIGVAGDTRTIDVEGQKLNIYRNGNEDEPDTVITTSNEDGETITLEEFIGMKSFTGKRTLEDASTVTVKPIENAIRHTLTDCHLAEPKWIEFTWRGDARMQPRDIILFTEEDGSKNYYEIDNLTLDHKDGGMTSKVKAIYKFAYTGE